MSAIDPASGARPSSAPPRRDLPSDLPRPPGELETLARVWATPRGWRVLSSVNNTVVGLFYIGTAFAFFLLAGVLGLVIRSQLALPENTLVGATTYNQIFTMHGTVMMFLFAVPMVEAIAVYLLPGMLGARDLPFPRLSAYAFWAYAIGGFAFFLTLFAGLAPDGGWFMYPPLSSTEHSPGINADFWLLGIGFIEISAIAGAIELIVGILLTRAPGMTLARMPIFAWAMLVVAVMIVFAFPPVIAGTTLLELERALDWPVFDASRGGDPILWQHLFWFFGHPEVYIIFLPAAGLVSMMVPTLARTPLAGYRAVVIALVAVGVFSFALWAHHMFTAGLSPLAMTAVSAASLAVAIPTGMQVFAWMATLRRGRVRPCAPTLFILGFFFIFVLGGLTGVMVAVLPFDWQAHDTYFIVAHLHYVLIGGMVFPMFAAFYYWAPLVRGRRLSERVARWVFGCMFVGFNVAFFPMHIVGLEGMPRRVYTYAPDLGWTLWNQIATAGAFLFAAGVVLFLVDAVRTLVVGRGERADDPWDAPSLEWLPSDAWGTRSIPQVASRDPLWRRPGLAAEVEAGGHWLPGAATGRRETIVTSPLAARPWHVVALPRDGWLPLLAAAGTAAFFLLLTVKWVVPAFIGGAIAIAAILAWLWGTEPDDLPATVKVADRAPPSLAPSQPASPSSEAGVRLPVGATGRRAHTWWAMLVLLAVDGSIFASMVFAHLHVSMLLTVCPPPGAATPAGNWLAGVIGAFALAAVAAAVARRGVGVDGARGRTVVRLALAVAIAAALAGTAGAVLGHLAAGLSPRADAWSGTIAALLGYAGFHAVVVLFMGGFALAKSLCGRLRPDRRAALDTTATMIQNSAVQGIVTMLVVALLPTVLG